MLFMSNGKPEYVKIGLIGKNNYKVTVPKKFMEKLGWENGDYVKVYIDGDKICYEKVE